MKKKRILAVLLVLALCSTVCLSEQKTGTDAVSDGFYPVSEVMAQAGYFEVGELCYETQIRDDLTVSITFDLENGICNKNQYAFDIKDQFSISEDALYLSGQALSAILGCEVTSGDAGVALLPYNRQPGEWTRISRLIAHAGGAVRGASCNSVYTNSLEALIQNYNLGHRIFEFDFTRTSDGELALIHDWKNYGLRNGKAMTAEGWKAWKAYGNPVTRGRYTTMLLGDLLDQMLVNRDMHAADRRGLEKH